MTGDSPVTDGCGPPVRSSFKRSCLWEPKEKKGRRTNFFGSYLTHYHSVGTRLSNSTNEKGVSPQDTGRPEGRSEGLQTSVNMTPSSPRHVDVAVRMRPPFVVGVHTRPTCDLTEGGSDESIPRTVTPFSRSPYELTTLHLLGGSTLTLTTYPPLVWSLGNIDGIVHLSCRSVPGLPRSRRPPDSGRNRGVSRDWYGSLTF